MTTNRSRHERRPSCHAAPVSHRPGSCIKLQFGNLSLSTIRSQTGGPVGAWRGGPMKRLLAMGLVVLAVSGLLQAPSASAAAYPGRCHFAGGGNNLKWKDLTTTSSYSAVAHAAIQAWNSTSTQ